MTAKTDNNVCSDCINRIYNARNEIMCRKQLDCSQYEFYCSSYVSENFYEMKEYLIKEDRVENGEGKVKFVFISCGVLVLVGFGAGQLLKDTSEPLLASFIDLVLSLGMLLALYKAKTWALVLSNIVYLLKFIVILAMLVSAEMPAKLMYNYGLSLIMLSCLLYFINADKDFKYHWRKQKGF